MKKQKPWLGFSLALLATMTWGSLPVIAQQALKAVDAPTLVWIRFLVASLVLFALLGLTGKLPRPSEFSKQTLFLLVLGIIGISANFVLVAMGLHYISPTTTQVLWQLSPFTMILVGVGVFKHAYADQNHGKGRELPQHLRGCRRNIVQTHGNENEVSGNADNTQHQ